NAELIDGVLYTYNNVNLAFACDTKKGLLVPVIKNADKMSIGELAKSSKNLANAAIEGRIQPDDLNGGTFTVSNLGAFGVTDFTPVINTPQTAILGVCGISLEPVRAKDGSVVFEDKIGFSLTSDHQVVDGALAAKFLKKLSESIMNIEKLCGLNLQ
ncbi:MAG: 2-oxo acid dehydrogenase subunit E2, partial [Fibrobacteres bacterium]|nr:2-oxo acid dehydrogenase subunit E2 [Fibrobacterota bacterium]